eukprot:6482934-Alexandrium_andersonii.AAC.1
MVTSLVAEVRGAGAVAVLALPALGALGRSSSPVAASRPALTLPQAGLERAAGAGHLPPDRSAAPCRASAQQQTPGA